MLPQGPQPQLTQANYPDRGSPRPLEPTPSSGPATSRSTPPTRFPSVLPPYSNEKPDTTTDLEADRMSTCTQSIIDGRPDARQEGTMEIRGE